jgi:hypothetical protein
MSSSPSVCCLLSHHRHRHPHTALTCSLTHLLIQRTPHQKQSGAVCGRLTGGVTFTYFHRGLIYIEYDPTALVRHADAHAQPLVHDGARAVLLLYHHIVLLCQQCNGCGLPHHPTRFLPQVSR